MADANTAQAAQPDLAKELGELKETLSGLVKGLKAMADNQSTISETIGKLSAAPATAAAKEIKAEGLTLEAVSKLLNDRDTAREAASAKSAARNNFIAEKMKGVPKAYQNLLPDTADEAALIAAEQKIRQQMRDDAKAAGFTVPDIAAADAGGTAAVKTIDTSKMSAIAATFVDIFQAPVTGVITLADFVTATAVTANDTNYWTFALVNLGPANAGTQQLLNTGAVNTTKATGGSSLAANIADVLTLNGGSLAVNKGDILQLTITKTASATTMNTCNFNAEFSFTG